MHRIQFDDPVILVALHKPAEIPESRCFLPVHVGAAGSRFSNIAKYRDDEGENISSLNPYYCELTALYWFWKNCSAPKVGLCHYRRFFASPGTASLAGCEDFQGLGEDEVIVPRVRRYYTVSVRTHFRVRLGRSYWESMEHVMAGQPAREKQAFERVGRQKHLHLYNMFVLPWDLYDDYMRWLFAILGDIQEHLNIPNPSGEHARMIGHMGERLFNVWLEFRRDEIKKRPLPVMHTEGSSDIKKAVSLARDLVRFGRKGRD